MPYDSVLDLGPGVRALDIPAAFDIHHHTLHEGAELVSGDPLTVRSEKDPWWYVASFPSRENALVMSSGARPFGWLTRVDGELLSGSATASYVTDDWSRLHGEIALASGRRDVDLLLDGSLSPTNVLLRRGGEPGTTSVRIHGFRSYQLFDEEPAVLRPVEVGVASQRGWSRFYGTPSGDLAERIRYLRFCRLDEPRLMHWFDGLEVLVVPGQQISQAVYLSGTYEPTTTAVLQRLLHEGDTFIDVGANVGMFTMIASRCVGRAGRVVAFEPSGREFARLRYHIDHNRLDNIEALQMAAGGREGTAVLRVADALHAGLNTIEERFMYTDVREAYREKVQVVTIDDVVSRLSISKVAVIKVDVEGAEADVIAGAAQTIARDRPALILEIASAALAPGHGGRSSIESLLRSHGYSFVAVDGDAAVVRRVGDLTANAENFVAAPQQVIDSLQPMT
jgi:FkbM family methyltransferase